MLLIWKAHWKGLSLAVAMALGSASISVAQTDILDSGGFLFPEQASYNVHHYDIDLFVDPTDRSLHGSVITSAEIVQPLSHFVLDLDTTFTVHRILYFDDHHNPILMDYERRHGQIWARFPITRQPGDQVKIEVEYEGHPRMAPNPPWGGGFTWAETPSGDPWIGVSCQLNGADLWWPVKDHPSDRADSISLKVTVANPLVVAGPGELRELTDLDNGYSTYSWFVSNPINNYALSMNIAPYDIIEDDYRSVSGNTFPIYFWVLPENLEKAKRLMVQIKEHMAFYEEYLGPYPFQNDKYGIVETPFLGMEHQTLIAYGAGFINDIVFSTDSGFDDLHHHELGHEWWGNKVTAYDWKDFWIHEGFCTYMQALYAEHLHGAKQYQKFMASIRKRIGNIQPVAPRESKSTKEMNESQDAYMKGAWFLHTLRYLMGDDHFFTALRQMADPDRLRGKIVGDSNSHFATTDDFLYIANNIDGNDLTWLFEVYLRQEKLPFLKYSKEGNQLNLHWTVPGDLHFPMPVEIMIDGSMQTIQVPSGGASVNVKQGASLKIDPDHWILKELDY
ncbi:MAG: M1 family metallopeptidase [Balneolales bacterium]